MMKQTLFFLLITSLFPIITGCHSGEKTTPLEIDRDEADKTCIINDMLRQVDSLLKGQIFETHCLDMHKQFVLSFWIVHPDLNPDASEYEIQLNTEKAFGKGINTAYYLLSRISCIRDVFDCINPMIVDRQYYLWYRDVIPIRTLTIMANDTDEQRMQAFMNRHHGFSYFRVKPVKPGIKVDMAIWPMVRSSLHRILNKENGKPDTFFSIFETSKPNAAAYPILLDEYSSVQVYFPASDESTNQDEFVYNKIESLVELFAGSSLLVDIIQVGFTGNDGMLKSYCNINGSVVRKYKRDEELDLRKQIRIYTLDFNMIKSQ